MMLVPESHDAVALHDAMSVGFCFCSVTLRCNQEVHFNFLVYMLPRKWPLFATLEN